MFLKRIAAHCQILILSLLIMLTLTACPPTPSLQIKDVAVSPDPVVGQIVTLHVEITSTRDEDLVELNLDVSPTIHAVSGDTSWKGPMTANQVQALDVSVCPLQEGNLPIHINVSAWAADGTGRGGNTETIGFHSTIDSGKLIRGTMNIVRYSQTDEATIATPLPIVVSPECSGQK
jgi:hypothetical protein